MTKGNHSRRIERLERILQMDKELQEQLSDKDCLEHLNLNVKLFFVLKRAGYNKISEVVAAIKREPPLYVTVNNLGEKSFANLLLVLFTRWYIDGELYTRLTTDSMRHFHKTYYKQLCRNGLWDVTIPYRSDATKK